MNTLGLVSYSTGHYEQAVEWHQKAFEILLNKFEPDHPDIATIYNNLGLAASSAGQSGDYSFLAFTEIKDSLDNELMLLFYRHLREGLPKDEALRLAKLEYLEESSQARAHPFFWAGFILVGDRRATVFE